MRAALDFCVESQEPEVGCAMAANMWLHWEARGHLTEGRRRLATLLEALPPHGHVKAKGLWAAGYLALAQTDVEAAALLLQESSRVAAPCGDEESAAFATQFLGLSELFGGAFPRLPSTWSKRSRCRYGAGSAPRPSRCPTWRSR